MFELLVRLDEVIGLLCSFKGGCCSPAALREIKPAMEEPKVCMRLWFASVGGFELEWKLFIWIKLFQCSWLEQSRYYLCEHRARDKAGVQRIAAGFPFLFEKAVTIKQVFGTKYLKLSMKCVHTYVEPSAELGPGGKNLNTSQLQICLDVQRVCVKAPSEGD